MQTLFLSKTCRTLTLALTVSVVTGCATYHPQRLSPARTAATFETRQLSDPGLQKLMEVALHHPIPEWPLKTWDMDHLTLAAFYFHPDLDVARAKWGVAKAAITTAGARPNPSLILSPAFATHRDIGVNPWFLGGSLDIPIETAGKRGKRLAQARQLSESARLRIAAVAWQVRSRLRTRLLALTLAEQTVQIWQGILAIEDPYLQQLDQHATQNEVSPLVETTAHVDRDNDALALQNAQKQLAEARVLVADAIGVPVAALDHVHLVIKFPALPSQSLPVLRKMALFNRADILAKLSDYAANESVLQLEIAKQYPDIHLGPGYLYDQGQNDWSLGLTLTLPILNHNQGPIAEAMARRAQLTAEFNVLQSGILGELDRRWAGYQKAAQQMQSADALLSARQRQEKFLESANGTGAVRQLSIIDSRRNLAQVHLSQLNAMLNVQQAVGALEDAVERPLSQPVLQEIVTPAARTLDEK